MAVPAKANARATAPKPGLTLVGNKAETAPPMTALSAGAFPTSAWANSIRFIVEPEWADGLRGKGRKRDLEIC